MVKIVDSIKLDFATISLRSDGIIENRGLRDVHYEITKQSILEIKNAIDTLSKGQRMPLLTIPGLYIKLSDDAKKLDLFKDHSNLSEIAIIINSLPQRLIANFYLRLNPPPIPTRYFSTEAKAVFWLKKLKEQPMVLL